MKKIFSRLILLGTLLPSILLAQVNPIGIDTTTGQQKVANTVTLSTSSTANVVISESDQTINGEKTFATQNGIKLPTTAPNETNGVGLSSGILSAHDGTAARTYTTLETAQNFTANKSFHSGVDALFYSDTGSTLKAAIFGDGARAIVPLTDPGMVNNCGFSVSGSTFTIAGDDGTALSATNPCQVSVRSNTAGRTVSVNFTANVTATFGSSSDTDGNLFGITDADWGSSMPMFLGVLYNGTTPYFTISRLPFTYSGAAAADLCQKGDTDCDAQTDVMILTTGLTLASFVNLPITPVGWFGATYATSGGAWTFTVGTRNGFNSDFDKEEFTMPSGQNGAASGKYLLNNGGTAPVFTNNNLTYSLDNSGKVTFAISMDTDGGTDGSGAVDVLVAMPYASVASTNYRATGAFFLQNPTYTQQGIAGFVTGASDTGIDFSRNSSATATSAVSNGDFTNGARSILGSIIYRAVK